MVNYHKVITSLTVDRRTYMKRYTPQRSVIMDSLTPTEIEKYFSGHKINEDSGWDEWAKEIVKRSWWTEKPFQWPDKPSLWTDKPFPE